MSIMVRVRVSLFASLRARYRIKDLEVDCDGSLRGLVDSLAKTLGKAFYSDIIDESGELREDRIVLVNGKRVGSVDEVELKDGDKVAIFPPLAGG